MRGNKKTGIDERYAIDEYMMHRSPRSIASELNTTANTIVRILKSNGVHIRTRAETSKMIKDDYRAILNRNRLESLYSDKTIEQISKEYHVPLNVVIDLVHEYGLEKEGIVYQRAKRESVNNIDIADLISKYKDDKISLTRLSDETGHSILTLANKLKNNGVQIRSRWDRDTIRGTMLSKYGVDNYAKTDECKKKISQTCMNRYGVASFSKTDAFKTAQSDNMRKKMAAQSGRSLWQADVACDRLKLLGFIQTLPIPGRNVATIANALNYDRTTVAKMLHKYDFPEYIATNHAISSYENDIIAFISSIGITNIERNTRAYLDGKEIDIYLPDFRIGIEFNGNYWHSDIFKTDHSGRSTYHQEKSLLAESKGIFIYHIFEYEWADPAERQRIENQLTNLLNRNKTKIYARKCEVRSVAAEDKADFLSVNHLQGNCPSSDNIGLYDDDKLVSVMCFKRRRTGKYKYELVRFCSLANTNVIGGASKLLSHFAADHLSSGERIVSYNNITKTTGKLYKTLGFEFVHISSPNYVWLNNSTHDILTRYQCKMKNEAAIMHSRGYVRICDAGTKTWSYTKR